MKNPTFRAKRVSDQKWVTGVYVIKPRWLGPVEHYIYRWVLEGDDERMALPRPVFYSDEIMPDTLQKVGDGDDPLVDFILSLDATLYDKQTWFLQEDGSWMRRGSNDTYTLDEVHSDLLYTVRQLVNLFYEE